MLKSTTATLFALAVAATAIAAPKSASAEEVYVLRGAFDVFSAGMNQMTKKMQSRGINAKAYSNGRWTGLADNIIKRHKQGSVSFPIVIMGHSVGGQEASAMANKLGKAGVPVKLVVGFDPGLCCAAAVQIRFATGCELLYSKPGHAVIHTAQRPDLAVPSTM